MPDFYPQIYSIRQEESILRTKGLKKIKTMLQPIGINSYRYLRFLATDDGDVSVEEHAHMATYAK